MAVAFVSQTVVAYKSTSTIEWYGEDAVVVAFIGKYFVNAIDFSFEAAAVDFTNKANKLAFEFETVLINFGEIPTTVIDFVFEVQDVDYTIDANLIDHSQELT